MGIIVYDITNASSFDDVEVWAEEIISKCPDIPIILCGNKYDLSDARAVSRAEAEKYARFRNFDYIESSALSAHNVESLFVHATRLSVQRSENVLQFRKEYFV